MRGRLTGHGAWPQILASERHLQVQDLVEDEADGEGAEPAGSQGSLEVTLQGEQLQ